MPDAAHIDDRALYTISGAARALGDPEQTTRQRADRGLIAFVRDSSGRRLITGAELKRIKAHRNTQETAR